MEFRVLPAHAPERTQLARWYHAQWGQAVGTSLDDEQARLERAPDAEGFPLLVGAFEGGPLVGGAQIKRREMPAFPQHEYWLSSVYVADSHRGRGLASHLVEHLAAQALQKGVRELYLQTEALDGGLYARLGWQPICEADSHGYHVLVMVRRLHA